MNARVRSEEEEAGGEGGRQNNIMKTNAPLRGGRGGEEGKYDHHNVSLDEDEDENEAKNIDDIRWAIQRRLTDHPLLSPYLPSPLPSPLLFTRPSNWILATGVLEKRRDGVFRVGWAKRRIVITRHRLMYYLTLPFTPSSPSSSTSPPPLLSTTSTFPSKELSSSSPDLDTLEKQKARRTRAIKGSGGQNGEKGGGLTHDRGGGGGSGGGNNSNSNKGGAGSDSIMRRCSSDYAGSQWKAAVPTATTTTTTNNQISSSPSHRETLITPRKGSGGSRSMRSFQSMANQVAAAATYASAGRSGLTIPPEVVKPLILDHNNKKKKGGSGRRRSSEMSLRSWDLIGGGATRVFGDRPFSSRDSLVRQELTFQSLSLEKKKERRKMRRKKKAMRHKREKKRKAQDKRDDEDEDEEEEEEDEEDKERQYDVNEVGVEEEEEGEEEDDDDEEEEEDREVVCQFSAGRGDDATAPLLGEPRGVILFRDVLSVELIPESRISSSSSSSPFGPPSTISLSPFADDGLCVAATAAPITAYHSCITRSSLSVRSSSLITNHPPPPPPPPPL